MNEYLIDREALGRFVDEIIKKKPLPVNSADELPAYREKLIKALDDKICAAIFGNLSTKRLGELNEMLDRNENNPDVFKDFFTQSGINLEETIADTMIAFGKEYLGGQNVA